MVREAVLLLYLIINSLTDIRKRQICMPCVICMAVSGVFRVIMEIFGNRFEWQLFLPLLIGTVMLILSIWTKSAIGMGDALLLLALGLWMSMEELLIVMLLGTAGSGIYGALLLAVCRRKKEDTIPFVPFLLGGYVGGLLLWR
ncbi:MAG: prepilin peptidase [Blautia sp.]|nr:prepilin peptidase [Blautia sp.]